MCRNRIWPSITKPSKNAVRDKEADMKKSELRNLDTNHIPVQRITGLLETFALKHSARLLPDIMERAEQGGASYREFLLDLLQTEVKGRNERRLLVYIKQLFFFDSHP